jgi:hypothetical protein
MLPSWLKRLARRPAPRSASLRQHRRCRFRPRVEELENRVVPTTVEVVPALAADGLTTFATLQEAVNALPTNTNLFNTVQIEPGSKPGDATVATRMSIQGDPAFGGAMGLKASGTEIGTITVSASSVEIRNLFLDNVTLGNGDTFTTVVDSIINGGGISQAFGTSLNRSNYIFGNVFLNGAHVTLGNTPGSAASTASYDQIIDNLFYSYGTTSAIVVENETAGMGISGNQIIDRSAAATAPAILAVDDMGTIGGNIIHYPGSNALKASDAGGGDGQTTNLAVQNNVITTGGTGLQGGTGLAILIQRTSANNPFTVAVTDNSLDGNKVGVTVVGNSSGNAADFGNVTISGNDFRGYTGTTGDFAVLAFDNFPPAFFVTPGDIFSVSNPFAVVAPLNHVIPSAPLTGGAARLTGMYLTLGGGPPSAADLSQFAAAIPASQAQAALTSQQAIGAFLSRLYLSLIPPATEGQAFANFIGLQKGTLTEEQLIVSLVSSPGYYNEVGQGSPYPNGSWLLSLYLNLMGRQPSATELNNGLAAIAAIGLRGVAQQLVTSAEFRTDQVLAYYGMTPIGVVPAPDLLKYGKMPSPSQVNAWVHSGLDLRTIQKRILAGQGIAAVVSNPQGPRQATVNTAYSPKLKVLVTDVNGDPVPGVSILFKAPASPLGGGPSGLFSGGELDNTAVTDLNGLAVASTFTANIKAGSFTVTATVAGLPTLNLQLTNLAGAAALIRIVTGSPQSAVINTAFAVPLQVLVQDGFGNVVSGATVTFKVLPATNGAGATFNGGSPTFRPTTATGRATAPPLTANATAGSFTVQADVGGLDAFFDLTNLV